MNSTQALMLIEATGIQDYVFGSNELAQNIGASELVTQATTDWVFDALPGRHNVQDGRVGQASLVGDGLDVQVVYAGGGNAMLLFADDTQAGRFARQLTRRVLEQAPGLNLVLLRRTFEPDQTVLADLHQALRAELARRKLNRARSTSLAGLGVNAACVFTGAPAVAVDDDGRLISAEVQAKLAHQEAGRERLKVYLEEVEQAGYQFVYNFDQLGHKGESSYLAVIHTDGNAMGRRIERLGEQYATPEQNDDYAWALHEFSASVEKAADEALTATVAMLLDPDNLDEGKLGGVVPVPMRGGQRFLPFRPIVFGGDDVTFVCEGRLGLTVAAKYLAEYAGHRLADNELAHARAGVAVVHSHYPFSRAYELADQLAASAKRYIKAADPDERALTALDWHFAVAGLVLPLSEVRAREYTADAVTIGGAGPRPGNLLMRPLRLSHPDGDWRAWTTFSYIMGQLMKEESEGGWADRRNQVKALRDALRAGPEAVRLFLYEETLPEIAARPDMQHQGWQGDECGYYDAIEALDFYVPLRGGLSQ